MNPDQLASSLILDLNSMLQKSYQTAFHLIFRRVINSGFYFGHLGSCLDTESVIM